MNIDSTPPSQTDVAWLRSLLIGGQSQLEEWLGEEKLIQGGEGQEDDLPASTGLLDEFDGHFSKTLDFLGGLGGVIVERGSTVEDMDIG